MVNLKKEKNDFEIKILSSDSTKEIEEKLFALFSKIFQGLDATKFKLYEIKDTSFGNYGEALTFSYNIHYGHNRIDFIPILNERFWRVECQTFAERQMQFSTTYPRTGKYLYSCSDGKIAYIKNSSSIPERVAENPLFRIFDDGTTNASEIEAGEKEKDTAEKERLEKTRLAQQEEENHLFDIKTVTESCDMTFDLNYIEQKAALESVLRKALSPFKTTAVIDISDQRFHSYSSWQDETDYTFTNKRVVLRYLLPVCDAYPFTVVLEKVAEVTQRMESVFGARLASKKFDYRFFYTEQEALDYVQRRKTGSEELSRIINEIISEQAADEKNRIQALEKENEGLKARLESYDSTSVDAEDFEGLSY